MTRTNRIRAAKAMDLVEASYRLDGSEATWLETIVEHAGPDLVSRDLHGGVTIGIHLHARGSRADMGRIDRAGATPADQPVAVAH